MAEKRGGISWRAGAFLAEAAAQIGCLTVVIVLLALGAGLWLDSRLGTKPWFTLGLVLASIPVSLYMVVRLALSAARRAYPPEGEGATREQGSRGAGEQGSGGAEEQGSRGAEEQGSEGAEERGSRGAGE